jgi:hypothetical protein
MRVPDRTWLHRDLPCTDPTISPTLSGPTSLSASIDPVYEDLIGDDGLPVLLPWHTLLVVEASDQVRAAGIITGITPAGTTLAIDCTGYSGYVAGQPFQGDLSWGGPAAGTTGNGVDPMDAIRALWTWRQNQPSGNLGVGVSALSTPYRLGVWRNARKLATADQPNPPASEAEESIPIDRVWGPGDQKPQPATGKTVYWEYALRWYDGFEVGAKIDEICTQVPLDYVEAPRWADPDKTDVDLRLEFGYPRLGRRQTGLRFVEGENVVGEPVAVPRTSGDYANVVHVLGAGEGAKRARATVSRISGGLRREATLDAGDVSQQATLVALGNDELDRRAAVDDITAFTVLADHPNAPVGSYGVGDDVLVQTHVGWRQIALWVRITSFDFDPAAGTVAITCARSDGFRYDGGGGA